MSVMLAGATWTIPQAWHESDVHEPRYAGRLHGPQPIQRYEHPGGQVGQGGGFAVVDGLLDDSVVAVCAFGLELLVGA
ncbi:hypothetical protein ITI46_10015 [Streptomyces oryzae]|uniref:Uncharacterized protein n=1 Tax=Streptomyces oryzae TaxID=1434886 RepID=A0ABS3X9F3_9ACTN|nr:hypothetical protein [Streptomyces oryzae]MBO8192004.1 hypothetical protein [Streptomyces oryzae]